MVARGLRGLDPPAGSIVVIENVGNLVCPALFDLGEAARVVLASVTEGADKPLKYPHMFRQADLVLLNKTDLLPYVDFDLKQYMADLRMSARTPCCCRCRPPPATASRPGTTGCGGASPRPATKPAAAEQAASRSAARRRRRPGRG